VQGQQKRKKKEEEKTVIRKSHTLQLPGQHLITQPRLARRKAVEVCDPQLEGYDPREISEDSATKRR
jgi:hypothetical protein